jgi:uncharacterized membrane protein
VRANSILFRILALFFVLADAAYIVWSIISPTHPTKEWYDGIEWVGAIGIALSALLSTLISFFLWFSHRGQGGELPEDLENAEIDDGEAEQGFFSPWSWWPIMLALSAGLVFGGLAVGVWISIIGVGVLVVSLIGWQYEYYRGYFAH